MFQPYLYKLYYSDEDKYKSEYAFRFNQDNTIHVNIQINGNPCFIYPDPSIYEKLIDIYKIDSKIKLICNSLPEAAIKQFKEHCIIGEIYQSNNIEGVSSTRKEISEVLQEVKAKKKERNLYGIVSQYHALMNNLHASIKTCQEVRDIYDKLFLFDIRHSGSENLPDGEIFRRSHVSVVSEIQKEIHKGVYPESEIISAMNSALSLLNDDNINMIIRVAAFHYLFGYIHPFYDGNGRMSRYISSSMLMQELNQLIGFRISYTIKDNLSKYYKMFKICNDTKNKGDISPFVKYFIDMIYDAEESLLEELTERYDRMIYYTSIVENKVTDPKMKAMYLALVQATLFSHNGASLRDLEKALGIKPSAITLRLKKVENGLLLRDRINRESVFKLDLQKFEQNWI